MFYNTPAKDMTGDILRRRHQCGNAAVGVADASQIDTIFDDQGLPHLGFANDLLYIAGAIAPGSFNDVTFGNNVMSFIDGGGADHRRNGKPITLTGYGYYAGPGYDLATGLGSPNGTLLARAMTEIAHAQMSFSSSPDMLDADGSGLDERHRPEPDVPGHVARSATVGARPRHHGVCLLECGVRRLSPGPTVWRSRSLQSDFDPNLVRCSTSRRRAGSANRSSRRVSTCRSRSTAQSTMALQASMTSPFDFADFTSANGAVRVARAVAVAETAGGADDTFAIVRVRQNGENALSLTFYKVDDLTGAIDGKRPDEAGYLAAIDGRAYQLTSGGTALNGPGYGNFGQAGLANVDAGDLIAMKLVNHTTGAHYLAFAHANETVAGQRSAICGTTGPTPGAGKTLSAAATATSTT